MNEMIENRRNFLKRMGLAAAALPFFMSCGGGMLAQKTDKRDLLALIKRNAETGQNWTGAIGVPDTVSWRTVLAGPMDAGERMIISGTVYRADGKTPLPNALLYLYHTDAEGYYGRSGEPRHGRYHGWMLTGTDGRYEFESIKPAPYPGRAIPAHIHMTLTTRDIKEDSVDSILFEGDRFITAVERGQTTKGGFNPILKMEKGADGILRGVRDIRLWV